MKTVLKYIFGFILVFSANILVVEAHRADKIIAVEAPRKIISNQLPSVGHMTIGEECRINSHKIHITSDYKIYMNPNALKKKNGLCIIRRLPDGYHLEILPKAHLNGGSWPQWKPVELSSEEYNKTKYIPIKSVKLLRKNPVR